MESTLILSLRHWMIHDLVGSERGTYLKLCLAWSVFVWGTVVSINSEPSPKKCLCSTPSPPPPVCEQTFSTWSHLQCSDRSGVLELKTLNPAIPFGFLAPTSLCDFWWTSHKWRWTCPVYCPTTSVLVLKLFLYCALQIDQQAALVR